MRPGDAVSCQWQSMQTKDADLPEKPRLMASIAEADFGAMVVDPDR